MTDTEKLNEALEHLRALVEQVRAESGPNGLNCAMQNARDFLKSIEPVEVAAAKLPKE